MKKLITKFLPLFILVSLVGIGGLGEFIFWRVLKVPCSNPETIQNNHPTNFVPNGKNNGPFRGDRWHKWYKKDLSKWFLTDLEVEEVTINNTQENIELSTWFIKAKNPIEKRTVIVVHGITSSKKHFNQLMPATILANSGLNVVLFDQRNHGDSSCPSGRYFAGTKEWQDINVVINWLTKEKSIPPSQIGVHGVSGGTLATQFLMAERSDIKAFSLDSPIFDFEAIVRSELKWNGIPSVLWKLAVTIGKIHGIDIYERRPKDGIDQLNNRALLVFHGTEDTRVPFFHSQKLVKYANKLGQEVIFFKNKGADHNEALLMEPETFERELPLFFKEHLN